MTLIEFAGSSTPLGSFVVNPVDGMGDLDPVAAAANQAAFDAAINGTTSGGGTDYEDGLQEVLDQWSADGVTAADQNQVIFLSDGAHNGGTFTDEVADLVSTYGADISAIGVGASSSSTFLDQVDTTGGSVQVTDLADLSDAVLEPVGVPELESVTVCIDGVDYGTFTPGDGVLTVTPLGYEIDCANITGYPYVPGTDVLLEIKAVFTDMSTVVSSGMVTLSLVPCFVMGTRIETENGRVRVEDLKVGDLVKTMDSGYQPVRWIGHKAISGTGRMTPIVFKEGAMGNIAPLLVSPQHRMLITGWRAELLFGEDEVLVPAKHMVNDYSILRQEQEEVVYYHLMFDCHEIVYGEGIPSESFHPGDVVLGGIARDTRNEILDLFPELAREGAASYGHSARVSLKRYESELLLGYTSD